MLARFCIDTGTHNATIHSLLAGQDGQSLLSASRDGVIRVWDLASKVEIRKILGKPLDGRSQWMMQIILVDQGRYILAHTQEVTGQNTGSSRLDIFHLATGNLVRTTASSELFSLIAVTEDTRILAVTPANHHAVFLYDLDHLIKHGELSLLKKLPAPALPAALAINQIDNDYKIIMACPGEGKGILTRMQLSGEGAIDTSIPGMRWPDMMACSSRGFTAVCERHHDSIHIFDPKAKPLKKIRTNFKPTVLEFSPDGSLLAVGAIAADDDRPEACRVYETGNWKAVCEYDGHDSPVTSLAFLGPELIASAGGTSREIHFWHAHTGKFQGAIAGKGNASRITGWNKELLGFCRAGELESSQPGIPAGNHRYFDLQNFKIRPDSAAIQPASNASSGTMPEGLGIDYLGPYAVKDEWLATAGEDQTISLWYLPDVHPQVNTGPAIPAIKLFVTRHNDWILWSQSGFYAASLQGDSFYGLHVQESDAQEGRFYPIDRFIKQLHRPAVIRAILETGSESRALEKLKMQPVDILPLLPPVVEVILPQPGPAKKEQVGLRFEVRPANSTVERIWVLKDDQFFWEKTGVEVGAGGVFEIPVSLRPGQNRFKILAESKSSKSIPANLILQYEAQSMDWGDEMIAFGGPPVMQSAKPKKKAEPLGVEIRSISIDFSVKEGGSKQGLIELTRNGEEIWKSPEKGNAGSSPYHVEIPLTGDDNLIEVWDVGKRKLRIYSLQLEQDKKAGDLQTRGGPTQDVVKPERTSGEMLPNLYLLSIGVSKLKNVHPDLGFDHLDFAHEDANSITSKFIGQKSILYHDVISKTLINEKATRKNILDAVKKLQTDIATREEQKKLTNNDTTDLFVVFLAGHGVEIDNEYYFWCHDLDIRKPGETGLGIVELGSIITALPGEVIFLIDTCRSGMIGRDLIRNLDPNVVAKLLISLNERAQYILTATERDTPSYEDSAYGHGYFTQGILDAFKQLPDVTALLLTDYVQKQVTKLSGGDQIPVAQVYGEIYRRSIYRK